jgi:hypothetical protein
MSPLPDDLRALAADQPEVADWPGRVRTTVRARRRRRSVVSAAAVLALVTTSAAGIAYAVGGDDARSTLDVADSTPTPTASAEAGPVTPTPDPTPSPVVKEPTASPTATRPPAPSPTASPTPEYPEGKSVITVEVTVSPARPKVGDEVTITIVARGDKATPYFSSFSWDRGRQAKYYPSPSCARGEPGPPPPAVPGESRDSVTFVYTEAGPDTVKVTASTQCAYYGGYGSEEHRLVVDPAASPSPTPTPSPTAS